MRYVVIGCSAAGVNAAAAIRAADPDGEIVLVTREQAGHYSRPMLSYFIAGTIDEDQLLYRGRGYLDRLGVTLHTGREITGVDADAHRVVDREGTALDYDRLLIVSGGVARQPEIPGMDLAGVFHFRTLADARAIRDWAQRTEVCVTLGGGLVSLKAAEALRKRGVKQVHLIIGSNRVMSQAMDSSGAAVLTRRLEANGVYPHTGESVTAVSGEQRDGCRAAVSGVMLKSGGRIECQMVLIGKGVRPDLSLVRDTPVATDWGILVDERMRTSVPDIYAAGDVAQADDVLAAEKRVNALWPLAAQQGFVAGCNMAGKHDATYPGWFAMNSLQVFGLPVITLWLAKDSAETDPELEVLVHSEPERDLYRKLVLRRGRLVGSVLVGDTDASGLAGLIRSGADVSAIKQDLLQRGLADYHQPAVELDS